ncbi:unnamed protein product [Mytilus coruscus]|uniref:Uncharacterized protein n=1 Tax=Mytilus coruscus TaxID=42192 RepID=A0A6J8C833_MYTCO|nr:unnamed protein product [Mytilus coruscus]
MDWFNNIGCEELENEAVTYFEQYIGSISEVLASSKAEREQKRYRYSFQGVEICEFTWRNVYNIGRSEFKSLKQHLNENGVTPRSHGLSGRKSNRGHSFEVIENTIKFIKRYADEFGLPLPAAPRATDNTPPILLPCSESKKYVHSKYVDSCVNSEQQYIQLTIFKEVWNACVPHIQFMKPKTDLCKTCFQLREEISGSISEDAKLVKTQKLIDHIQSARTEHNSAKCNRSDVYNENDNDENSLKWYRWDNFFTKYFKPLRGIGKFHHFRFTSDEVRVVFARETLNQPEKRLVLLKESANLPELLTTLPEVIQPAGLTEERRRYLYNEVRPFVQFNFCDEFCPRASEG